MQKLYAVGEDVLITEMNFDEQITSYGLIVPSDDGKTIGIKPRWGRIYAVGPKQKTFKAGQWILVEHGRWTRKVTVEINGEEISVQKVDVKDIIAMSEQEPSTDDLYFGS